ncbi:hypothetical protein [Kitasatospora fiedleri]|uniref:hypothetical protein n=1 Tax=Kitasatospora fiedleri TaxID=2991545 RepID=UPI00249BB689|nr:hypothetical protein [Kitasatospora fiedleri]
MPAPTAPPGPEPEPAAEPAPAPAAEAQEAQAAPAGPPRRLPRAAGVVLSVAGLLAVTAASAAVTVAVGRPDRSGHVAAVAASPSAAPSPSATPSPTPTPSAAPTPSPTVAPRPASTLRGSVSGGKHSGDLRYFLLPVPDDADPYGSPDGAMMSMADLQAQYSKDVDIKAVLDSWGFKEAATRTYRTRDGKSEVRTDLRRFGRADRAQGFADNTSYDQPSFGVDGVSNARGYVFKPEQQAYTGELVGIGVVGDVVYEVTVQVQGDPDKALLADAMKRARDRLANG